MRENEGRGGKCRDSDGGPLAPRLAAASHEARPRRSELSATSSTHMYAVRGIINKWGNNKWRRSSESVKMITDRRLVDLLSDFSSPSFLFFPLSLSLSPPPLP